MALSSPVVRSHAFYMAVSAAILDLVGGARHVAPGAFVGGGVDLSRALETALYFTCVNDPGLLMLFHAPEDATAAAKVETPMACLVAEQGFAHGLALRAVRRRHRRLLALRRLKDAIPRFFSPFSLMNIAAPPILFLARSQRFARFLMPLAQALRSESTFLVPEGDAALAASIMEEGFACYAYSPTRRPRQPMGRMIADYASHWAGLAETVDAVLDRLGPRLVVVPEGNTPEDEVFARVAARRGIASACVQQGWSPILHPGFCNMRFNEMLVWGEGFGDLLAPANPQQRFAATGNFHLADGLPGAGESTLFLFQGFDNWMGGRKSADDMVALAEAVAIALPQRPVLIRPHPAVPLPPDVAARLARHANIHVEAAADVPLAQAFAKSRISVSAYSSAILESVAAGVIPIVLNTVGMPRFWPDVEQAGAGLEVCDVESALRAIARLADGAVSPPPGMTAFRQRFFQARGTAAVAASRAVLARLACLS